MNILRKYIINCDDKDIHVDIETVSEENGVEILRIKMKFDTLKIPVPVKIEWAEPMVKTRYVWIPGRLDRNMHQGWAPSCSHSSFCSGAPVLTTIGDNGVNRETIAVSDVETPVAIRYCVDDFWQKYEVKYSVTFFEGLCNSMSRYEAYIRIDNREIPFYESIGEVYPWWCKFGYKIPAIPQPAEDALYSSWYNFHQSPKGDDLLHDLEIASDLGFRTVILDDGWQIPPSAPHGSYDCCGDWIVAKDKFPDFKKFVDGVHHLGMKLIVWFAVTYVGKHSDVYQRFKEKRLYDLDGFYALDPRYPDVREYLKDTYKRFLKEYDIDGFKLDFIDSFHPGDCTAEYNDQMDFTTIGDAVKSLLVEIVTELAEIKSDLLYEYRQGYIGPAINRFGNMLRVADCAYDSHINRWNLIDLRLLGYPVAVHSDMLYWSKDEPVSYCANQLLNIFFSVPQISVILADSTEEQKKLLKNYLFYWMENRDLLLHGKFRAFHPEMNYSEASAENDEKIITVLYADVPYTYTGKAADVFHNGDNDGIILENVTDHVVKTEIFDCFGSNLGTKLVNGQTIVRVAVPKTGMMKIRKQ